MKYILFILLIPVFCFGQKVDNYFDTIKVILLFSDIELKEYETTLNVSAPLTYKDFDYSTRWMTGYLVREKHEGTDPKIREQVFGKPQYYIGDDMPYEAPPRFGPKPEPSYYYTDICYLDIDKKQLSKNIIVWICKPL